MRTKLVFLVSLFMLAGCVPTYSLVAPATHEVSKGEAYVTTAISWNRAPSAGSVKQQEVWTLNGPALDSVMFFAGIPDGENIVKQKKKADRQVPAFSATMTPPELVSMVESYYTIEIGAVDYETTNVMPADFMGGSGMQIDYKFTGGDDVKRRGRTMLVVVDDKLYMISALGAALHYYNAMLPEFESMMRSARIN